MAAAMTPKLKRAKKAAHKTGVLAACLLFGATCARATDPFAGNPPVTPYWALAHWV
jgi:hypothetical protein